MSDVSKLLFKSIKARIKERAGDIIDWAIGMLGFFPQVALADKYSDQLRAFAIWSSNFLEELIPDDIDPTKKMGPIRLAGFDDLLEQFIEADAAMKAESNRAGLKGLAHVILETYLAAEKVRRGEVKQ
jgi:hypothetical protein